VCLRVNAWAKISSMSFYVELSIICMDGLESDDFLIDGDMRRLCFSRKVHPNVLYIYIYIYIWDVSN